MRRLLIGAGALVLAALLGIYALWWAPGPKPGPHDVIVKEGTIARNHTVRVVRDGVVVKDKAAVASLRRFKDDVREVKAGLECGIAIENFNDVKPGDVIEAYEVIKIARTLD